MGKARIQGGGRRGRRPPPEGRARSRRAARKVGKAPESREFVRLRPPFNVFLDPRLAWGAGCEEDGRRGKERGKRERLEEGGRTLRNGWAGGKDTRGEE